MIWTDPIEEYPEGAYIHPAYDGQGYDGRKYRPAWHAVQGALEQDFDLFLDDGLRADGGVDQSGNEQPDPEPMHDDEIYQAIFHLSLGLHEAGYTRKEIVARLRAVADAHEDHFGDRDSWDKAPHEKDVVLPGDDDE